MRASDSGGFQFSRFMARLFDVAVVAIVLYGAVTVHLQSNANCARIREIQTVETPTDSTPATWVTLQFKRQPKDGNPRDVQLVFTSRALQCPLVLDWNYISAHAHKMAKNGMNRVPAPLSAQQSPANGTSIELLVPLALMDRVNHITNGLIELEIELIWAGVEQDRLKDSVTCFYTLIPER